jgi:hypothetical protein
LGDVAAGKDWREFLNEQLDEGELWGAAKWEQIVLETAKELGYAGLILKDHSEDMHHSFVPFYYPARGRTLEPGKQLGVNWLGALGTEDMTKEGIEGLLGYPELAEKGDEPLKLPDRKGIEWPGGPWAEADYVDPITEAWKAADQLGEGGYGGAANTGIIFPPSIPNGMMSGYGTYQASG